MGGKLLNGKPISRNLVEDYAANFMLHLFGYNPIPYILTGSYRRGKEICNDIEIVFLTEQQPIERINLIIAKHFGYCENLNPRMHGLWGEVQFDIFMSGNVGLGAMLLHTTGNWLFNKNMRAHAHSIGMKLNQYGLFQSKDNESICLSSKEEDYFLCLNLNYKKPSERSI